ncbi:MAG TPA: hypothetical protein V6D05_16065 [Stenomitos sp.]
MQLTIVVHTERPDSKLGPVIDCLYNQTVRDLDVWIAGVTPPADLADIQAAYPVGVLTFPGGTTTAAMLNEAFARAQTDLVVTLDGSWMPRDARWLMNLTRHFQDLNVAAVSGTDYDEERVSVVDPWYSQDLLDFLVTPELTINFANAAFRRDMWRRFGFDSSNGTCADKHWAYQVLREGQTLVMDYDSRCHQSEALTRDEAFRRYWAMNLSFGAFIQTRQDIKLLYQRALSDVLKSRSLRSLARIYKMWPVIKQQRYWRPDPAQAMLAREQFVRTGKKWAL